MGLFDKLFGGKKGADESANTASENIANQETAEATADATAEAQAEETIETAEESVESKDTTADNTQSVKEEQKSGDALTRITANENVYIIVNNKLPKPWPAIDMNGYMHVYTDPDEAVKEADQENGFVVMELTGEELGNRLAIWQKEGIIRIRYSENGNRMQFGAEELGLSLGFNSIIQFTTIRFLQAMTGNTDAHKATAQTWWSALCHVIPDSFFIVPVCYEGEELGAEVDDMTMHLFPKAAEKLQELIAKDKGFTIPGYPYAEKAVGRPMQFRTLSNQGTGEEWLSAYTTMEEILPIWNKKAHFALALFDDMKENYSPSMGILINPLSTGLKLLPVHIAQIEKERYEGPKVFTPKPGPNDWARGTAQPGKKYPVNLYETKDKNANPPYAVIELPDGIYMRVVDFMFRKLCDEQTVPGNGYAMALFRLRMKEVEWLEKDQEKLDALAKRLLEEIPADRLVQALAMNVNGARELKVAPLCATIDK